jgi:hypothetical protein
MAREREEEGRPREGGGQDRYVEGDGGGMGKRRDESRRGRKGG